ncbi:uncharacterized protein N0V89_011097 [Didymosphaeria variabile]|uniref:Heterokaryon incompatibility domain-containing protein n=1 Tax=Didymosphaeria variabile TaxID=1932322 RepID=A0A9W8XE46_9PLEO|nr:uncharacterized protein N0V89_011097 [Didymosphaeria variabile]KAJ4347159.1 hypothetical protein N0V89_011097 [Didymosphaeria variabile]
MISSIYEALPQDPAEQYIRTIKLYPGTRDDPLQIEFQLHQIGSKIVSPYEAISWVWGNLLDNATLLYNGETITIRQNLEDALRVFRFADRPRLLWADALCINQKDAEEKSRQVAMMGTIYANASGVLIWLGNDHEKRAPIAFGEIKMLADAYTLNAGEEEYCRWSDDVNQLDANAWNGIRSFFQNDWFNRIWVQQEFGMNANATFYWGASTISRKTMRAFYRWFSESIDNGNSSVVTELKRYSPGSFLTTMRLSETIFSGFNFLRVLAVSHRLLATDPRDYVYGFLNYPSARSPPHNNILVTPDYSKTVEEVYFDVMIALIQEPRYGLQALALVYHTPTTLASETPSWVARWHHRTPNPEVPDVDLDERCVIGGCWRKRWDVLPSSPIVFQRKRDIDAGKTTMAGYTIGRKFLSIGGVLVDRVESAWEHPQSRLLALWVAALLKSDELSVIPPEAIAEHLGPDLQSMTTWLETTPYDDVVFAAALTLCCGLLSITTHLRALDHLDDFERVFNAFCATKTNITHPSFSTDSPGLAKPADFQLVINEYCSKRNFVRSEKGYFGLAPSLAMKGDLIAVFAHAALPYIIRPVSEGDYKLIGHCYVHGIMNGEAFETLSLPITEINLV